MQVHSMLKIRDIIACWSMMREIINNTANIYSVSTHFKTQHKNKSYEDRERSKTHFFKNEYVLIF